MARVNVYLPHELAREWRSAGRVNLSLITQIAIRRELARSNTELWLRRVTVLRGWDVTHAQVLEDRVGRRCTLRKPGNAPATQARRSGVADSRRFFFPTESKSTVAWAREPSPLALTTTPLRRA